MPGPATDQPPAPERLADVQPVVVVPCRNANEGRLWNEFVARYLGHSTLLGAQMRYFVRAADGEALAVLGFGAAAWKIAPRDKCVGWDPETRRRTAGGQQRQIPDPALARNLASHVLTLVERRLPDDWESRYALRPVLLETFCETPRFAGTCYRAASKIGATQGRGKTRRERALPVKDAEAPAAGLEADPQKIDRHLTSERLPKTYGTETNRSGSEAPPMRPVIS